MDKMSREVLALLLNRLREYEKARLHDLAAITALILTIRAASPSADEYFKTELRRIEERQANDPRLDLDGTYDALIRLLKDPGLSEEDRQEKFRRILEAFEGPPQ